MKKIHLDIFDSSGTHKNSVRYSVASKSDVFSIIAEELQNLNEGDYITIAPESRRDYLNLPEVSAQVLKELSDKK